jgi:MFS family permease
MSPVREAWRDFVEAARLFSRPARLYLSAEFLAWTAHGIYAVIFNLYLVEAGKSESFVGQAIASTGIGMVAAALPAGWLADRWGRRRTLMLGAALEGVAHLARAYTTNDGLLIGMGFVAGLGQSFFQIAAAPFLTDHSTPRERTHLFSVFFASALLAGVFGNALGGAIPTWTQAVAAGASLFEAYRVALLAGGAFSVAAVVPLVLLRGLAEPRAAADAPPPPRHELHKLRPIALNALLLGTGAGLVIPFMNLYFQNRFACTSAQIGLFFGIAQVCTALAALAAPAVARRFGKLKSAVGSQLLSLPFLVLLGGERHLPLAVGAFWIRATFMQASTPLVQAFIMEALPQELRARSTSVMNMLWNIGWAASATVAGLIIERFGYHMPFYITAVLYLTGAVTFYRAFRGTRESATTAIPLTEEAKGLRGEGPATE